MAQRQQTRLLPLIGIVVAFGVVVFIAWQWFLVPVWNYNTQLANLNLQIQDKNKQITRVLKERAALERFQLFSLPENPIYSENEYEHVLGAMVRKHGFKVDTLRSTGIAAGAMGGKGVFGSKSNESPYTALQFHLEGKVTLAALTEILKDFADTPLMHRVKSMTLRPVHDDSKDKKNYLLSVQMDIDALMVKGAGDKPKTLLGPDEGAEAANILTTLNGGPGMLHLLRWVLGPTGPKSPALLAKAKLDDDYSVIDRKNIFIGYQRPPKKIIDPGPPPSKGGTEEPTEVVEKSPFDKLDMRKYFKLVAIERTEDGEQAWLYGPAKDEFKRYLRLKASPAFAKFIIRNGSENKDLAIGVVLKVDYGAVYFKGKYFNDLGKWTKEKVYCIHLGESIEEALEEPITEEEMQKAGIKLVKAD